MGPGCRRWVARWQRQYRTRPPPNRAPRWRRCGDRPPTSSCTMGAREHRPFEAVARVARATNEVIAPAQRLTREEALRAATLAGAYLTFEEDLKGSIEPGQLADLGHYRRHDDRRRPHRPLARAHGWLTA